MPYIDQNRRPELNIAVQAMLDANIKIDGDLNYVLFKYFRSAVPPSYNSIKNFLGELNECAEEIRHRFLRPYEDKKIITNGDVYGV